MLGFFLNTGFGHIQRLNVVNEFQTDRVQRKNFPSKLLLFTSGQKAVVELLCHLL